MIPPRYRSTERLAADLPRQVGDLAADALALGRTELRHALRDVSLFLAGAGLAIGFAIAGIGQGASAATAALIAAGHSPVQAALFVAAGAVALAVLSGWFGLRRLRRLAYLPRRLTDALVRSLTPPTQS